MKLVAGSYERFLWGYDVKVKKQELQWTFAYPAHVGPIKCIASRGPVVATGGADDTIRIFDLGAHKDMGLLYKHEGAVTCLDFHNAHSGINHPTHLLSGSEDGSICIWDTDAWIHLLTMKAKKGPKAPVQDLSIHPSGLLALSIERNRNMKMWNLTKGRCSFTTKLPVEAEIVKFFPQAGESYALALGSVMEVRNAETGNMIHRLENDKRIFCMAQHQDNLLVTGGEDCIVRAWDTRSGKLAWSVANAHTNRIKGVAILGSKSDSGDELPFIVASASSDGLLKVWDSRMVGGEDGAAPVPLMQAETKARLTCLVSSSGVKKIPASEDVPEGDGVPDKQRSEADGIVEKTYRVFEKKKRKTQAGEKDPVEEGNSLPGRKRRKKQKHGQSLPRTPLSSTNSPDSHISPSSKRLSREKSEDADMGTGLDRSPQKKPKFSSKKSSPGPSKSRKSPSSGKFGKSIRSPASGKSGKSIKSPASGKSGKNRKL